jgi:hypothetical protein
MSLAGREPVPAGIAELVFCHNIIGKRFAERAFHRSHVRDLLDIDRVRIF